MPESKRFVSRLTRTTLALVLAGGRGDRLQDLTRWRAKPAVPFGGKFRIIDFTLSNCVNSAIGRYKAHSLIRHLQRGWGFLHTSSADALANAIRRAQVLYRDRDKWRQMQRTGMAQDFSWERSAEAYRVLYKRAHSKHQSSVAAKRTPPQPLVAPANFNSPS